MHYHCGLAVDAVIKTAAYRKSCDNLTAVLVAFDNFDNLLSAHKSLDESSLKEE